MYIQNPNPVVLVSPSRPGNGLRVAGFVLGLLGLLFSFLGAITVVLWAPLAITGLILGLVGVSKGKAAHHGVGLGRAGWILALIGIVIGSAAIGSQVQTLSDLDRCLNGQTQYCN